MHSPCRILSAVTTSLVVFTFTLISWTSGPSAAITRDEVEECAVRAAAWAQVHPDLLRAIAHVESSGNPAAVNLNRNGSYDVGLMQINSWWYRRGLESWWNGLGHPCVNIAAASWILKQCVNDHGYTWNAVGCYHVGSSWRNHPLKRQAGETYIGKIQRVLRVSRTATR